MNRHRNKKPKIDDIAKYFNKKYHFKSDDDWILPADVYKSNKWYSETLQKKKIELNNVKELLSNYNLLRWSKHTKSRDPSTAVLNKLRWEYSLEFQTQAWCKFYEIVNNFQLIPYKSQSDKILNSLHLCEAPGAFVCSLNHFLACQYPAIKWNWQANALNPYYEGNSEREMITDDRFIKLTFDMWHFGKDSTGDITSYENHLELIDSVKNAIMLITADGSVDCMSDPGNQEDHVSHLHYCETMSALRILCNGGSLVLKIFTMFEESTICLLYLLNCVFEEVHIFKPLTSKSGNSELYVVCLMYKGCDKIANFDDYLMPYKIGCANDKSMFDLKCLPMEFLRQIEECSSFFMELQIYKIKDNIKCFNQNFAQNFAKRFNHAIAEYFIRKYNIGNIPYERRITKNQTQCDSNNERRDAFYTIFKENSIQMELAIRCGKKYEEIAYSKFCTNENLRKFKFKRDNNKFYNLVLINLADRYNIINITHRVSLDFSTCHYKVLCDLKNSIDSQKDLIIIGPIVTNIFANLIYLLANSFDNCIFLKIGCIIFKKILNQNKLLNQLDYILQEYTKCIANTNCDLLQIIKPSHVINSKLFNYILDYNDNFAKYWHLVL